MTAALHYAATTLLAFAAFALLALAMPKHFAAVMRREIISSHQWLLRALGAAFLAITMWLRIRAEGVGIGLVAWCGVLTLAAFGVVLLLTYNPRKLVKASGMTVIAAIVIALFAHPA
jgi:FtsH-binding integral membrane protein